MLALAVTLQTERKFTYSNFWEVIEHSTIILTSLPEYPFFTLSLLMLCMTVFPDISPNVILNGKDLRNMVHQTQEIQKITLPRHSAFYIICSFTPLFDEIVVHFFTLFALYLHDGSRL